ncbi:MAG TPA: zf-HC2 domain-containing protein [Pyrinomonadaceae bacterium]|nr:zf-HC2 domain-containing protein [Pyrinomonadaceae bacterium]
MKLNSEELRSLYQRETARSNRRSDSDCLTEEVLARAVAGELDHSERERIADHLGTCSDCAKEFSAAKSIKAWADENAPARPIPFPAKANGHHRPLPEPRRRPLYLPYAIAASLLVLSIALGALLISKSRENQRLVAEANNRQSTHTAETAESRRLLEQESAARRLAEEQLARRDAAAKPTVLPKRSVAPQANVPIIDLSPQDAGRGNQNPTAATVQLSPDTDLFTLILNLGGEDSSRNYSLEVTDRNNRTIWTARSLRKSPYNNFTVAMRRRSFPAGEYRLKIYGLRDGRRQLIEEYAIRLTY